MRASYQLRASRIRVAGAIGEVQPKRITLGDPAITRRCASDRETAADAITRHDASPKT
jgi:hypothetical protein